MLDECPVCLDQFTGTCNVTTVFDLFQNLLFVLTLIRTDWDAGFIEGRQYGRGKSGGQVRDEYRTDFDSGRGGYGKIVQQKLDVQDYLS